jgi:hypothetical protein
MDGVEMSKYGDIKSSCKPKYARGGRVNAMVDSKRSGGKTVINIITTPPGGPAQPPAPPAPPPPPPPGPVPPQAGAAALQAMGAGGPPPMGQFKRGGRVKAGAASGVGRLADARKQKRGK